MEKNKRIKENDIYQSDLKKIAGQSKYAAMRLPIVEVRSAPCEPHETVLLREKRRGTGRSGGFAGKKVFVEFIGIGKTPTKWCTNKALLKAGVTKFAFATVGKAQRALGVSQTSFDALRRGKGRLAGFWRVCDTDDGHVLVDAKWNTEEPFVEVRSATCEPHETVLLRDDSAFGFRPSPGECGTVYIKDGYIFGIRCNTLIVADGCVEDYVTEDGKTKGEAGDVPWPYRPNIPATLIVGNHEGKLFEKLIVYSQRHYMFWLAEFADTYDCRYDVKDLNENDFDGLNNRAIDRVLDWADRL